jgi:hypothetical protein
MSVVGVTSATALYASPVTAQDSGRPPAVAEPAGPTPEPPQGREMNGHLFIPSELLVQPFVETEFSSVSTFGLVRSTAPTLTLVGDVGIERDRFTQLGYAQTFELQVKVLPWLAVRATATSLIYSGVSRRSVLNLGSTLQYGAGGGVTLGHRFGEALQVAIVADASYEPSYSVDFGAAIAASLRAREVDTEPLVTKEKGVPLSAGAVAAYAVTSAVGLQVMGQYEHTFHTSGGLRDEAVIAAGAVDLDLRAFTPIALGLLASYQVAIPMGESDRSDLWHYLDGGFFYTGRRDLLLGLEGSVRRFPQRGQIDSDSVVANAVLRYFW